jgi:putative MATE family efflux protein
MSVSIQHRDGVKSSPSPAAFDRLPRPLWQIYLLFLAPMVLSNLLQSLSGTLNGIYIGQLLGTQALAAVAGMFPVVFFFISLVIGLGAGASVLIGQAWGAEEFNTVRSIAGTSLVLGGLIGLLAAVLGVVFARQALQALGTPPDVLDAATDYARVLMLIMPLLLVYILFAQLLRGVGDTVSPLLALSFSTAVGLLLTPALILGWLGLPQMGIQSAAYASLVSYVVALVFLALRLLGRDHVLAPNRALFAALRIDLTILKRVTRIGLPTGLQMVVLSLSELAILALVNSYGSQATAAYGAVTQVVSYVQFPANSIAITASILGAQVIGAGKVDRVEAILRVGLWLNAAVIGSLVLLGYALSHWLLGLFITEAEVRAQAEHLLKIMLWSLLLFGFQAVVAGIMRASGVVLVPVAISIGCVALVQLPAAYALSTHFGLQGVWMAFPITYTAMLVLQTAYYKLVWKSKKLERIV